ncbi:hypothetical protein CSOJ01_10066 [Colletotrichum sojae]|uniref:Uncharacterized protein n=1 Tax=Colletotrichum sojae TaxID=2175907 RepID=A0A8H6J1V7_9PEZI|nr:hypothetical protein CSOJ01_10066 [Colletotrichum sojae]
MPSYTANPSPRRTNILARRLAERLGSAVQSSHPYISAVYFALESEQGVARAVARDSSSGDAAHNYSPVSVDDQNTRMILKLFQQSLYWIPSTSAVTLVRLVRASSERLA